MILHIGGITVKLRITKHTAVLLTVFSTIIVWAACYGFVRKPERLDGCSASSYRSNRAKRENNHTIFFIETSGETCLTARQVCSIESAARLNPSLDISVYMEANKIADHETLGKAAGQRRSCSITQKILEDNYKNIRVVRQDLLQLLRDTPLWRLVEQDSLKKSSHQLIHRSDAVRVAVLWKQGGFYLDLDCIVLRQLDCLENTVGAIDFIPNWVENGVMIFNAGHPFLKFLMKYMVFAFKPNEYISLGPATLTDALKYFCDRADLPVSRFLHCKNSSLLIQPFQSFYAINNRRQNAFYHEEADLADWEILQNSFLTHVYDAGNGNRSVPLQSLYAMLASKFCPVTYKMALKEGHF